MIRIFFLFLIFAAMISWIFHVSAGWGLIIAVVVVVGLAIRRANSSSTTQYVKPSAMWKCPYCFKRVKLGATACHHCARSLVRATEGGN